MIIGISGRMGSGKNLIGSIIQHLTDPLQKNKPKSFSEWYESGFHASDWKQKAFARKLKEIVALLTGCTIEDLESQEFKMKELGPEWNTYGIVRGNDNLGRQVAVQATPHLKYSIWLLASGDNQQVENILTYRKLLQVIGTDALRNVVHENIWVNALMADYKSKLTSKQIKRQENRLASDHDVFLGKDTIYHEKRTDKEVDSELKKFINSGYPNWIITDMRFPNEMEAVEKRGGITIRVNRDNGTRAIDLNPHPSETSLDSHKFDYTIENDGSLEDLVDKVRFILQKENII